MLSDAVLIALIAFAGTAVTAGPAYLGQRKTRRVVAAQGEENRAATSAAIKEALAPVEKRMDDLADDMADIREDVGDIRTRVAVHDDRWSRVPLRAVRERRNS